MVRLLKNPAGRDYLLWLLLVCHISVIYLLAEKDPEKLLIFRNSLHPDLSLCAWSILAITYFYLLATGILCCFYKPQTKITDDSKLPFCTVIVPAYNEGAHVEKTIQSLLASDYPADKFELIVINDGSADDTWYYITRAAQAAPEVVKTINLPQNKGKKNAIYIGVEQAGGEIVVTVDSDSKVKPDTLRELVSPMQNPAVGAVAGSIRVEKPERSFVASLMDVLLVFGCEFLRAAQSVTGLVLCTPGALSEYRKSALLPVMDEWLNQTFMNRPALIGEDRALATLILRSNYRIVHQSTAQGTTCVPDTIPGAIKMLLRWTRGDIRENLVMTGFAFRNFPSKDIRNWVLVAYWVAFMQALVLTFFYIPSFFYMLFYGAQDPVVFLAAGTVLSLMWASIPALIYSRYTNFRKAIWALFYGTFCPFFLALLNCYSFLTLRNSNWMTRKLDSNSLHAANHNSSLSANQSIYKH